MRHVSIPAFILIALLRMAPGQGAEVPAVGEALEQGALTWTTSDSAPWVVQSSPSIQGGSSAKAGAATPLQSSWLETTATGPSRVSFSWRVSSEAFYDRLRFYVDGALTDLTSGEVDWARGTYFLTAGSHTLRWEYAKDNNETSGSDTGWLDHVVIEPTGYWRGALPQIRGGASLTVDSTRNRLVLFGGINDTVYLGETWESDGASWQRITTSGPTPRVDALLTYDSVRQKCVLFGGYSPTFGFLRDTWLWDGLSWSEVTTTVAPDPASSRMVFSTSEQRTLLFEATTGDTWAFNGAGWLKLETTGPGVRYEPALGYDATRNRVVLFGGAANGVYLDDTWEWDGTAWTLRALLGPEPRYQASLAFDPARGRSVLTGGSGYTGSITGTWEWDGTKWFWSSSTAPISAGDSPLAFLPSVGRSFLMHSTDSTLYSWDGTTWAEAAAPGPGVRWSAAMSHDTQRNQVVLFGGNNDAYGASNLSDTWTWDGGAWTSRSVAGPEARSGHQMAHHGTVQKTVLFGGAAWDTTNSAFRFLGDTWQWDGAAWQQAVVSGPASRSQHAMCYDSARQRVVLFGGTNDAALLGDTWEWDGSAWSQRSTTGPEARYGSAMAYDVLRQRAVLFGGITSTDYASDVWEWDGSNWTQSAETGPTGRAFHTMTYHAGRGKVVMAGGYYSGGALADTWEFDGNWGLIPYTGLTARSGHTAAYEPTGDRLILVGGSTNSYNETWEYLAPSPVTGFQVIKLSSTGMREVARPALSGMQTVLPPKRQKVLGASRR